MCGEIVHCINRGHKIEIVLIVVDGLVGAPFDHKSGVLYKGLTFVQCDGLDTRNRGVGDWKSLPLMAGDLGAGRQGHKIIVPLGVTRGVESDGSHGSRFRGVRRRIVFENLHVRPEF